MVITIDIIIKRYIFSSVEKIIIPILTRVISNFLSIPYYHGENIQLNTVLDMDESYKLPTITQCDRQVNNHTAILYTTNMVK